MHTETNNNSRDRQEAKILLVEDTPSVLRALERQLELAGYIYVSTANGQDALAVLKEERNICLVISDWMMPVMDGFELLAQVRAEQQFAEIPFLMVTGKDSSEDAVRALQSGANDYIVKPYHPDELLARVRNLVKVWEHQEFLTTRAVTDDLTGLYNKRHFRQTLDRETNRIRRYGGSLALILFDIDHFKKINDDYGHPAGDLVLGSLGRLVQRNVRNVDCPCRYGGEEFAVILPCTGAEGALVLAERLRRKVAEELAVDFEGHRLTVTCSFGVGEFSSDGDTAETLEARTDKALYKAKEEGRNRVTAAS